MRTVEWNGEHGSRRWEARGSVRARPGRFAELTAFGTQRCADFEVGWQLTAGAGSLLRSLDIRVIGTVAGHRLNRTLLLELTEDRWSATAWYLDRADLPAPGVVDDGLPLDAVDVVLDSCPLTHLVPLRRLGLVGRPGSGQRGGGGHRAVAGVPALRVLLPSLAVVPTRQRYHWVADQHGGSRLRHAFAGGDPTDLLVDPSGVPVEFGGLRRVRDTAQAA